jgi:hypothetical protein
MPESVYVVVQTVAVGQVFVRVLWYYPGSIIPP